MTDTTIATDLPHWLVSLPLNLDDIDAADLKAFRADLAGAIRALDLLDDYARLKLDAIDSRKCGAIGAAQLTERRLDRLYESLPLSLKW